MADYKLKPKGCFLEQSHPWSAWKVFVLSGNYYPEAENFSIHKWDLEAHV